MTVQDDIEREKRLAQQAVAQAAERVDAPEITDGERKNGWTPEALRRYRAERDAGAELMVDPHSLHRRLAKRPTEQNTRYSPFRWR